MSNDTNSSPIISDLNHAIIALREVISQLSDPDKMSLDRRFQQQREEQLRLLEEVEKRLKAEMLAQTIGMPTHSAIGTLIDADLAVRGVKSAKEIYDRVDAMISDAMSDVMTEAKIKNWVEESDVITKTVLNRWLVGVIVTILFGGGGTLSWIWNQSFEARTAINSVATINNEIKVLKKGYVDAERVQRQEVQVTSIDKRLLDVESTLKIHDLTKISTRIDENSNSIRGINTRMAIRSSTSAGE